MMPNEDNLRSGKAILIVEDEKPIARVLALKLERAGFSTRIAENAMEAREILAEKKFNLLVLDIIMPEEDGFKLLEDLRKTQPRELPIIIWSNLGQPEDIKRAKDLGATDYWVKLDTPLADVVDRITNLIS